MELLIAILSHEMVLNLAITGFLALVGLIGRQIARNKWAADHLAGIGAHVHAAVGAALEAVRDEVREARADDSPGGSSITADERRQIRDAAMDSLMGSIGLDALKKALGLSLGRKRVTDGEAEDFVAGLVRNEIGRMGADPFVNA
jgi:hypothetical protein